MGRRNNPDARRPPGSGAENESWSKIPPRPSECFECDHEIGREDPVYYDRLLAATIEHERSDGTFYYYQAIKAFCSIDCMAKWRRRMLSPAFERSRGKPSP